MMKCSRLGLFTALYCAIILFAAIATFELSDFNYVFLTLMVALGLPLLSTSKSIRFVSVFFGLFTIVELLTNSSIIYFVLELMTIVLISIALYAPSRFTLLPHEQKITLRLAILAIVVSLCLTLFNSYYIGDRFIGLLKAINTTASWTVLLLIFIYEQYKQKATATLIHLIIISILWLYFAFAFKTRTILFAAPYFLYQFFTFNKKYLFVIISVFVPFVFYMLITNWSEIQNVLRLEEDASFLTRYYLYETIFNNIVDNHFVIPGGFNSSTLLIQKLAGSEYSVHNDFLRYLYDWGGVIWGIFFISIYRITRKYNTNTKLIIFFFLSNALHNTLFSYILLIPLILILNTYTQKNGLNEFKH